jgi:hypothetical protein
MLGSVHGGNVSACGRRSVSAAATKIRCIHRFFCAEKQAGRRRQRRYASTPIRSPHAPKFLLTPLD